MSNHDEAMPSEFVAGRGTVTSTEPVEAPKLSLTNVGIGSTPTLRLGVLPQSAALAFGPIHEPTFGDYLIQCEIARGGMGVVYKAFHQSLNRVVALKCMQSGALANPRDVQRFQGEAQAAAKLDHPHIVPVFDVGSHANLHYYAMGFIDGETLLSKLRSGPLDSRVAAVLLETLARAVAYAHQQGVVHRDLKPGNILIDQTGQPRITDFGLAKRLQEDSNITVPGEIIGTPNYIPPEQADGCIREITPAVDIYALGAILYCVLTGRPPFLSSSSSETLRQVLNCEPILPRHLNPGIPKDLETICLKCLQKIPAKRYSSALELAEDLRRYLAGQAIVARPITAVERGWRWCRRNPVVASLTMLVAVVAVAGASVSLSYAVQASSKAHEAEEHLRQANLVTTQLRVEQDRTNQVLYHSQIQQAYKEWDHGNLRRFGELLDSCEPRYRGWEHRFLSTLPHQGHQSWTGHTSQVRCVAVSPDGLELVSGGRDRVLRVWDIATRREIHTLAEHRGEVSCVAFSQNGRWLISGSADKTVRVWDRKTMKRRRVMRSFTTGLKSLAMAPDGQKFVAATVDGTVKVIRFATFEELLTLHLPDNAVHQIAISPDGKLVAAAVADKSVKLWDIETGAEVASLNGHVNEVNCVAYDHSGKWLVSGDQRGMVKVWDIAAHAESRSFQGSTIAINTVAFSGNGQRVLSGGHDQMLSEWDLKTGILMRRLRGHSRPISCMTTSPAFPQIISGSEDNTLKFWESNPDQESVVALGHSALIDLVAFDPTHALVATSSPDHSIRIWDMATGKQLRTCQDPVTHNKGLAFTPDAKQVLNIDSDGQLHLWDVETGQKVATRGQAHSCGAASLSRSLKVYATSGANKIIQLWNVEDGEKIAELSGHSDGVYGLAISPDDQWIASVSSDKTVRLWDASRHQVVHVLNGHTKRPRSVAFDSTGRRLVTTGDDASIRVWEVATGKQLLEMHGHIGYVRTARFSPDGKRIVSAGLDAQLKLWDAQTGDEILTLRGHHDPVLFAAFSPNGRFMASCGSGKVLRIWDAGEPSQ